MDMCPAANTDVLDKKGFEIANQHDGKWEAL
jgi:hypothetical protein